MNLRQFAPAIMILVAGLLFAGVSRKPSSVSSFDDIRRVSELHVEVLSCSNNSCLLKAGNEVRNVISTEQHAPGFGSGVISNQAGTFSLTKFVQDKIPAANLGIVEEDPLYLEGIRLVTVNGITYESDNCEKGQMALGQPGSESVTCPRARD